MAAAHTKDCQQRKSDQLKARNQKLKTKVCCEAAEERNQRHESHLMIQNDQPAQTH